MVALKYDRREPAFGVSDRAVVGQIPGRFAQCCGGSQTLFACQVVYGLAVQVVHDVEDDGRMVCAAG